MANYVLLINWTEQGVRNYVDTTKRADAAVAEFARLGGKLTDIYWTLGPYDIVGLAEFPDDETATAAAVRLAAGGNVRTTTMRAFDRAEVNKIIAKAKG
ncbi:MAG: GYD domain-containing protein [Candidatus Limnocylindrales bacterium]